MTEIADAVKREIGQHFVFGFHGQEVSDDIRTLICDYYLGNVILMKRNVKSIVQVHDLVCQLQLLAKNAGHERPLMIGIDQENGLVSAFSSSDAGTQFPGAMALAATGSLDLTEQVFAASAKEMHLAGINWSYSPVADVNSDPRNPVIGVRSFGDNPDEVARYAQAASRGLASAKVAPSPKHFPGHGNTHVDSHLSLPRIMTSREELAKTELVPFRGLVDGGVASIMTGHMALPLITGDDTPCSLSRAITSGLLRDELGFAGVIVTDCLEMEAVAEKYGSEGGAVLSLQAGADVVMICHRYDRHVGAFEATYAAVQDGRLPLEALVASGHRINAMKDSYAGSWADVLGALDITEMSRLKQEHASLSRLAYLGSITCISDGRMLPKSKAGSALLLTPRMESINLAVDDAEGKLRDAHGRVRNTAGPSYEAFAASLAGRVSVQHVVYTPEDTVTDNLKASLLGASCVVFATRNAFERGEWQRDYLRLVLSTVDASKMVLVTTCAPYDLLDLKELDVPCLASYEFTVPALDAVAAVIFGEAEARGTMPVQT